MYPEIDEKQLGDFAEGPCQISTMLFEHAAVGGCDPDTIAAMVDDISSTCCEHEGVYVCDGGPPDACDAECSLR